MGSARHLKLSPTGHLTKTSSGHLKLILKMDGDRIENGYAQFTVEHDPYLGFRFHYTIFDLPLEWDTVNSRWLAEYTNKVPMRTHTSDWFGSWLDTGARWLPVLQPNNTSQPVQTTITQSGSNWTMIARDGNVFVANTRTLGTVTSSTAAGTYNNLLDNFPIKVYLA